MKCVMKSFYKYVKLYCVTLECKRGITRVMVPDLLANVLIKELNTFVYFRL